MESSSETDLIIYVIFRGDDPVHVMVASSEAKSIELVSQVAKPADEPVFFINRYSSHHKMLFFIFWRAQNAYFFY